MAFILHITLVVCFDIEIENTFQILNYFILFFIIFILVLKIIKDFITSIKYTKDYIDYIKDKNKNIIKRIKRIKRIDEEIKKSKTYIYDYIDINEVEYLLLISKEKGYKNSERIIEEFIEEYMEENKLNKRSDLFIHISNEKSSSILID